MNAHRRCQERVPHNCGVDNSKIAATLAGLGVSPSMLGSSGSGRKRRSITPVCVCTVTVAGISVGVCVHVCVGGGGGDGGEDVPN